MHALSKAELEMGLDSMLFVPYLPRRARRDHPDLRGQLVHFHPDVEVKEWREEVERGYDILHKEYLTPAGKLETSVRLSADWTHGDHIPFVDDYQIARQFEPLISKPEALDALQYVLQSPTEEDKAWYAEEAQRAHQFVDEHGSLLVGGWGAGWRYWLARPDSAFVGRGHLSQRVPRPEQPAEMWPQW